jgi:hypothetical protein
VEKAHGDAAEVFDETSADTLLGDGAYPADAAISPGTAPDTDVRTTPPPDQTEPGAGAGAETGTVVSPKGTNS